jgi:hypothetical protein
VLVGGATVRVSVGTSAAQVVGATLLLDGTTLHHIHVDHSRT